MKGKNDIKREYLSVAELAEYSGISERTLRDLLKSPTSPIPYYRVGTAGRIIKIKKSEFNQWMSGQRESDDNNIDQIVSELLNK